MSLFIHLSRNRVTVATYYDANLIVVRVDEALGRTIDLIRRVAFPDVDR